MRIALSAVLVLALAASPALAHGGQYKGPSDAAGPNAVGGGSVSPPTNPGGAAGAGPAAAGASSAGAATGAGRTARGGSERAGAQTAAGATEGTKGWDVWEFWWENNKDRFLNLKDRLTKNTNVSGSPGSLTGRGRKIVSNTSRRPTRAMIEADVIPELIKLVKTSDDRDILDSAVLALGRTTEEDMADQVVEVAIPMLGHNELSVQSSAALALGVLGSPRASKALQDVLQDNTAGRQLTGGKTQDLVRAFSALSLGLIGDEESVRVLKDIVQRLPDSEKDVKVCAIVGLGLLEPDVAAEQKVPEFLAEILADRKLDPLIQSYVPTSLGKLGNADTAAILLKTFTDRDSDNLVIQSCAIGLGQVGTTDQVDVVEALMDYVTEGRDHQTRHFAIIALAELAGRDENPERSPEVTEVHKNIQQQLLKEISGKGKSKNHRSWAALAGALYSRGQEKAQPLFVDRIQAAYKDESDPAFKSAFAVALGLLNDQTSAEMIFDDFNKRKEIDFRGYAGVALGFLQYTDAADALRSLCQNKGTTPTLRLQAATGLGLMSDTQAVSVLIETMTTAKTLGVSSAVAKALGLIGDMDSIGPLNDLAADERAQKITRAFACVALGIVGEKTPLPWNAAISSNNNYRAKVPSIEEVLDIL